MDGTVDESVRVYVSFVVESNVSPVAPVMTMDNSKALMEVPHEGLGVSKKVVSANRSKAKASTEEVLTVLNLMLLLQITIGVPDKLCMERGLGQTADEKLAKSAITSNIMSSQTSPQTKVGDQTVISEQFEP
jgi:hypothetical protein